MCKNTNVQDLGRNKEKYFVGHLKYIFFFSFLPSSFEFSLDFLIKMYKITKFLFTYKPRAVWFFLSSFCIFLLFHQ